MFSVTFAIADALGRCGLSLGKPLLLQGGRMKTHSTRNRSLCAAWRELIASTVRTGEKSEFKKEDTNLGKEILSVNVGSYWWREDKYVLNWRRKKEVFQQKQIKLCFSQENSQKWQKYYFLRKMTSVTEEIFGWAIPLCSFPSAHMLQHPNFTSVWCQYRITEQQIATRGL